MSEHDGKEEAKASTEEEDCTTNTGDSSPSGASSGGELGGLAFHEFFTMENITDCGHFTIDDFPQLSTYMGTMEWNIRADHESLAQKRWQALYPIDPDQPMPIFHAGQSNFRFRTLHDRPNYDDYDAAVAFLPDLMQANFSGIRAFEMPASDCVGRSAAEAQRDTLLYHAALFREQKEKIGRAHV